MNLDETAARVAEAYLETPASVLPIASGHMHQTFLVKNQNEQGIYLQKVRTNVFTNPLAICHNALLVHRHLLAQNSPINSVRYLERKDGLGCLLFEAGCWRAMTWQEDMLVSEKLTSPEQARELGRSLGQMQIALKDFPADELFPVLPGLHDTLAHWQEFTDLASSAASENGVGELTEFASDRDWLAKTRNQNHGFLGSWQVNHRDTKVGHCQFRQGKAIGWIDGDTFGLGQNAEDVADSIRSILRHTPEYLLSFAEGYFAVVAGLVRPEEIEGLVLTLQRIAFELFIRRFKDYFRSLSGHPYFADSDPEQSLAKAREYKKLLEYIERNREEILSTLLEAHKTAR